MALDAVIFDLDGTLVDTNALHVEAWQRAFAEQGYRVAKDRIFTEVGKGGDTLVPAILGEEADARDGDALRETQPREFKRMIAERPVRVFPGARELMQTLRARGLKICLATSSNKDQVEAIERSARFELGSLVDSIVTADDASRSKPAPDIVFSAVSKLGMSPAQCAAIGDTPHDADACNAAGVVCLGLLCGGNPRERLIRHGARTVWRDPDDVLAHLDEAMAIASPGSAHLTHDLLATLMRRALDVAREGMDRGEAPIGCAIFRGDAATLVASAHNEMNATQNKTAHAEIVAFARGAGKCPMDCRDLILVSTLEPCVMCTGAAMEAAVDTIIYAMPAPADSGPMRVRPPQSPESQMPRIVGNILAHESRALFEEFLTRAKNPEQARYVKQLLGQRADR